MKKYFFVAMTAIAAIVLVGCKKNEPVDPTPEPGTTSKVVLNAETLELAVNEEQRLRATLNPVKEGVAITFTSDNKEVATVATSGIVTGVAEGTANIIASAEGYESDTCVVTVISEADAFAWGGFFATRNENFEILNDKDTVIETLRDGRKVKCILVSGSGFMWDSNIFLEQSTQTGLAGEGFMAFIDMWPVLQILDSLDEKGPNYYYLAGDVYFVDADKFDEKDTTYAYCAPAGKMDDAAKQYGYYVDETSEESGIIGSELWYMDAATFSGYPTVGLVGTGVITGSTSEAYYKMNVGWFTEESSYGLKVTQGADGKYSVKEPAEWASIEYTYYENLPEESNGASARRLVLQAPNSNPRMEKLIAKHKLTKALDKMYKK